MMDKIQEEKKCGREVCVGVEWGGGMRVERKD